MQHRLIIIGRKFIPFQQTIAFGHGAALFFALFALRHLHADLSGKLADSLRKRQVIDLHEKFEDVAADAAAEAVKDLLILRHRKRRRLFMMKRAQTDKVLPLFF